MAIEYPFWNDRCPETLVRFGRPIEIESGHVLSARRVDRDGAGSVEETQDALSPRAEERDAGAFTTLLEGTAGVGGVYDVWRRIRGLVRRVGLPRRARRASRRLIGVNR